MQEVLHMSMFKKKKVSLPHVILYILFLFVYYTVTKNLSASVLGSIIAPLYYKIPLPILFTIGLLLLIIIDLLIPSLAVGFLFFFFVPEQYHKNNHWRKCFLKFVLPGEIIRFLISFVCLGHQNQIGGRFSIFACFLFENTYLIATKRDIPVRHDLEYIPADFLAFAFWYLLYAAIYGVLIALVYRFLWQREAQKLMVYHAPTETPDTKS